jgi:S-adenosylmethionine:tRNA ribosyltransferase-isomerase
MSDASSQHVELRTDTLDYELPERCIATSPSSPRDAARMLVVSRTLGDVAHRHVRDLPEYLRPGDLMVVNDTAVAPARLIGRRPETHGRIEGLFLDEEDGGGWRAMLKSNGRLRPGDVVELVDSTGAPTGDRLTLAERDGDVWSVTVQSAGPDQSPKPEEPVLERAGRTPLPPYILRARTMREEFYDDARDRTWYQTVFADPEQRRSVAAPTAGLHFTPALLDAVKAAGVARAEVTLHVGMGTFKPIAADVVADHPMHEEWYEVRADAVRAVRETARAGGRVLAVGTTSVRTLESLPNPLPQADATLAGATDLLITPPYAFRHTDALLTNFHLPRSTLLALVAALIGIDRLLDLYQTAIDRGYRFYSYGDAMLILP